MTDTPKTIDKLRIGILAATSLLAMSVSAAAQQYDPDCVVEQWPDVTTSDKIIDINFSDADMPNTWKSKSGIYTPSYSDGGYSNGRIEVATWSGGAKTDVTYPLIFHNCTFANKNSYGGKAGTTAAFARIYYEGQSANGNSAPRKNDWSVTGHTVRIEDNVECDVNGTPTYGEAGYAHLCRDAAQVDADGNKTSMHGWVEIDHVPYIDHLQWAWSSSAWGRGVKCDIKVGEGDWEPLVWMGSNKQKQGYTVFSDQGYFIDNEIKKSDVSIRWRIWDGDGDATNTFQTDASGANIFASVAADPYSQQQPVKIHKIRIYGNAISPDAAAYARENPVSDFGEFTYGRYESDEEEAAAQDSYTGTKMLTVAADGSAQYTTIQAAVDAVAAGERGIIYIRDGIYDEHVNVGSPTVKNKYISLIGQSRPGVILTSSVGRGDGSHTYDECAALSVYSDKFYAEGLTIRNTCADNGQSEALYVGGDAYIFRNCDILGHQDTFKSNAGGRGYFTGCTVEGTVDFIYDSGLVWFEDCEIRSVGAGYITAPADASLTLTKALYDGVSSDAIYCGIFFSNCRLTAAEGVADGSCYLGRPWKEKGGAAYINCIMGKHIAPAGWKEWNSTDVSFTEYGSKDVAGAAIDLSGRVSWSRSLTDTEVDKYANTTFLFAEISGKEIFTPKSLISSAHDITPEIIGSTIKWEASEGDVAFIVLKDGEFDSITTSNQIEMTDTGAAYTIMSVSRRGVTKAATAAKPLKAFPTAAGFGKLASGGRGGQVVYVSSLADSGEGSLRWAFEQYPDEPLTIVFCVSGEIVLQSPLKVNRADWTLAGQTAPGEGIVITHDKVNFGGSQNFIVRNMRFRIGQRNADGDITDESACGAENCQNFIFDHCNFGWSVEENFDTQDSHFLTVQYSIVHEGLYAAGHSKGSRGYGCQWGGSPATYHHNLLANNLKRSCRFNGSRGEDFVSYIEFFNNVTYNNGGGKNGCYGGENTADITNYTGKESAHECNFVGNYYIPGPATQGTSYFVMPSYARDNATSWGPSKWYLSGNVMLDDADKTANNWKGVCMDDVSGHYTESELRSDEMIRPELNYYKYTSDGTTSYDYDKYAYAVDSYETAEAAYNTVLSCVGTWNRDLVEQRIISEVSSRKCQYGDSYGDATGIIDTESGAEGFYAYTTDYTAPVDTDGDGMPDEWETEHGCDPTVADNNRLADSGYTMLEVYLNSLFGEKAGLTATKQVLDMRANHVWVSDNGTIHCSEEADYTVSVIDMSGRVIGRTRVKGSDITLPRAGAGFHLVTIEAPGVTTRVVKVLTK